LSGFASTLAYVEAGFGAEMTDSRHRALYLLKELGLFQKFLVPGCQCARRAARA
jgi:hypothetical protein